MGLFRGLEDAQGDKRKTRKGDKTRKGTSGKPESRQAENQKRGQAEHRNGDKRKTKKGTSGKPERGTRPERGQVEKQKGDHAAGFYHHISGLPRVFARIPFVTEAALPSCSLSL